jgi:hypothetical protein
MQSQQRNSARTIILQAAATCVYAFDLHMKQQAAVGANSAGDARQKSTVGTPHGAAFEGSCNDKRVLLHPHPGSHTKLSGLLTVTVSAAASAAAANAFYACSHAEQPAL